GLARAECPSLIKAVIIAAADVRAAVTAAVGIARPFECSFIGLARLAKAAAIGVAGFLFTLAAEHSAAPAVTVEFVLSQPIRHDAAPPQKMGAGRDPGRERLG